MVASTHAARDDVVHAVGTLQAHIASEAVTHQDCTPYRSPLPVLELWIVAHQRVLRWPHRCSARWINA